MKDNLMYQKARIRWLEEGESNSAYFHLCINYHRRWNNFVAIQSGGSGVEGVPDVKNEVKSHFQDFFLNKIVQELY